jgi:hypothetical protein
VCAAFPQETLRDFRETFIAPSSRSAARSWVNTDKNTFGRNAPRQEKRTRLNTVCLGQAEVIELGVRERTYCFQQMQPSIGAMGAREIRRDSVR